MGCYCYLMNENEIYYGAIVEIILYGVGHIVYDTIIKVHYGMNELWKVDKALTKDCFACSPFSI